MLRHLVKTRQRLVSPLGFDLNEVVWIVWPEELKAGGPAGLINYRKTPPP